jgi:hypothetical protein
VATVVEFSGVHGVNLDSENATPSEIVSTFSDKELFEAARETSDIFNGLVLSRALVIVQARTRCFSLLEFGERLGMGKTSVYRWAKGKPTTAACYERAIRLLAIELAEHGVH